MMLFAGRTQEGRKQFYVNNVIHAWNLWKEGLVPFEWAGFVWKASKKEYCTYFNEDLDLTLPAALKIDLAEYVFNEGHGSLYHTLVEKFNKNNLGRKL